MHCNMDRLDQLESMQWSSKSSPSKGPKRLCKFCLCGVLLPILCLIAPIYIRFQALRPHFFTLAPSDMKLLNQVGHGTKLLPAYFLNCTVQ